MNSSNIKVAILDGDPKSRKHLVRLLRKEADIDIVAEAESDPKGMTKVEEQKPDVILMDSYEPFTEGVETTKLLISMFPETRIIILSKPFEGTKHSEISMRSSLCLVGACYPLCQVCSPDEILSAIRGDH